MPTVTQLSKRNRKTKQLIRGFDRIVRDPTRGFTSKQHTLESQINQLDYVLELRQNIASSNLLANNFLTPWTKEWVESQLRPLDLMGKILTKLSESNIYHLLVDDIFPVTTIWDAYTSIVEQSEEQSTEQTQYGTFLSDDSTIESKKMGSFYWDLYVLIRRPLVVTLKPEKDVKDQILSGLFRLGIPSFQSTSNESKNEQLNGIVDENEKNIFMDPYELVRERNVSSESRKKKMNPINSDYICPNKTNDVVCNHLLPEIFDKMLELYDPEIKLIKWRYMDGCGDEVNNAFELEIGTTCFNPEVSRVSTRRSKVRSTQSTASKYKARVSQPQVRQARSTVTGLSSDFTLGETNRDDLLTYTLHVRFHPVYSLRELKAGPRTVRMTRNSSEWGRYMYLQHHFIQPSSTRQAAIWETCSRYADTMLLDRMDRCDKGSRRKAIRLLAAMLHASDKFHRSILTQFVTPDALVQLLLHHLQRVTEQTAAEQYSYIQGGTQLKPLTWSRQRTSLALVGLVRELDDALQESCLPGYNRLQSNSFPMTAMLQLRQLKKSRGIVHAWLNSDAALKQIIIYATNMFEPCG